MDTGDAERNEEAALAEQYPFRLRSTVFKAGHHGSSTSNTQTLLWQVQPQLVVASCGLNNDYGHPHREVIQEMQDEGIDFYRTDLYGTVTVTAQADGFISAAPEGYGTMVAEGGASLSGGQKQRISIARAVLKPAGILIFDDSTSALDLKTEADLYAALKAAKPGTTKIIVAQRIASVRQADRIVVLRDGRIDACGTHEELLASCKTYQDIYHSQIGEEEESHG